jgi:heat shock protein HtpX
VTARAAAAVNTLKTLALYVGIAALLGGVGWLLGGYRLLSIFAFCGLLGGVTAYWYADRALLGSVGARELPLAEATALHATVDRLALRAGVPRPRLYLIRDGHPRVLSAGRAGRGHALVVTTGLLGAAQPDELEGLVAHEIAHAVRRDHVLQTSVGLLSSTLLEASRIGGWLQRWLLYVLSPLASAILHLLVSPKRELAADRLAAELAGDPHGLADALLRLEQANELVLFAGNPGLEPLYVVNPFEDEGLAAQFRTHPPTIERVRRLRALDPEWRDPLPV